MFTRLSSIEILDCVKHHIEHTLTPELQSEPAIVAAQMLGDLVEEVQRLIEHEPQWLSEETVNMLMLLERSRPTLQALGTPEAAEALEAIDGETSGTVPSEHEAVSIAHLKRRYSDVSFRLEKVTRSLGLTDDEEAAAPLVAEIQQYLVLRSDREIVIAGSQPMRGRG